jgi:WD40 repeat protein/class 3 adenylate cyclase
MTGLPSGTIAFLFTDIEGSTRLLEVLRARYADVLADQRTILRESFAKWHGHEVDTQGDAFFVAFTRAGDALRAAIDCQRSLAAWEWPSGVEVRVRMGIHCGEPLVAATGYVGMDVHRAARIAAAGHGGQILLSSTARDLVNDDLPPHVELRDVGSHRLKDLRDEVHLYQVAGEGLLADFPPLMTLASREPPPTPGEAPYRGLQSFDAEDADLFYGREEVVTQLVAQITGSRFAALVGASGSGKSSVVRAGLLPALGREGPTWRIHYLTPTAHPLEALAQAVAGGGPGSQVAALADDLRADARSLSLFLRGNGGRRKRGRTPRVLVIVDQLEEVFTLCRDERERVAFLEALAHASGLDDGPATSPPSADRVSVLVAIRADFYAFLAPFASIRDAAASSQLFLGAMSPEELRRAIEEPARQRGWDFVPGLVDLLLHEVGHEPGALPLLSHALLETWLRRRGTTMTLRSFAESGGVRGAIARTADRTYEQLDDDERRIARDIFLRLTELGEGTQDTRRRVRMEELLSGDANAIARVRQVAGILADARLITVGVDEVEVAHEALIREWPMLREWLNTDRENLRVHRRATDAAREWEVSAFDEAVLYRGTRLNQLRDFVAASPDALNDLEQRFLDASHALADREVAEHEAARRRELEAAEALATAEAQRAAESTRSALRLRRRAVFLAGALGAAALLAVVAVLFAQRASDSAALARQGEARASAAASQAAANLAVADSQRLGSEADAVLLRGGDPDLAALLALKGLHEQYTTQADIALQRALRATSGVLLPKGAATNGFVPLPDGHTLVTASAGSIEFWDIASGKQIDAWTIPDAYQATDGNIRLRISQDGRTLFVKSPRIGDQTCRQCPQAALYELNPGPASIDAPCIEQTRQYAQPMDLAPDGKTLFAQWLSPYGTWSLLAVRLDGCPKTESGVAGLRHFQNDAISPEGSWVATITNPPDAGEATLDVRRVSAPGIIVSTMTVPGVVPDAVFSGDGEQVAMGGTDGILRIFDTRTGKLLQQLGGGLSPIVWERFSPGAQEFLAVYDDGTVRLWDLTTGSVLHIYYPPGGVIRAEFSADGASFFTASADGTVRRWPTAAAGEGFTFRAGAGQAGALAYSSDGALLAVASNRLEVLDARDPEGPPKMSVPGPGIGKVAFGPGEALLAAAASGTTEWNVLEGTPTHTIVTNLAPGASGAGVLAASFSTDGSVALTGSPYTDVVWLSETRGWTRLDHGDLRANVATLSSDGTLVAGWWQGDGEIWIYDVQTATRRSTQTPFGSHSTQPVGLAFSPDGSKLVTGNQDDVVRVWDVRTLTTPLLELQGPTGHITDVAVTPDGADVLAASQDGSVRMWDLTSGHLVRVFAGHDNLAVTGLAVSPDGTTVAIGSADGTVILTPLHLKDLEAQVCGGLSRDLTSQERTAYDITSTEPACPGP